jgi:hypothetical protein
LQRNSECVWLGITESAFDSGTLPEYYYRDGVTPLIHFLNDLIHLSAHRDHPFIPLLFTRVTFIYVKWMPWS